MDSGIDGLQVEGEHADSLLNLAEKKEVVEMKDRKVVVYQRCCLQG